MTSDTWRDRLEAFFEVRGRQIENKPTLDDLCYVAGRNPALWTDQGLLNDLRDSILSLLKADSQSKILEIGCAAGFLANLVAPNVREYVGVDLAEAPLRVARLLDMKNARFSRAAGESLNFPKQEFDAAFCYDVFSNFPSFSDGEPIIVEMLRVVKPGGVVLVGSVPDRDKSELLQKIANELASGYRQHVERPVAVAVSAPPSKPGWLAMLARRFGMGRDGEISTGVKPEIISYYFDRSDFVALGKRLQVDTQILDIHALNPYLGTRFNAVFVAR